MTKKKKTQKAVKKAVEKKPASKPMTSREKILKYCEVKRYRNELGCTIEFGTHKYRMNRALEVAPDSDVDKIYKHLVDKLGLAAHIARSQKNAATLNKRRIVVTTDPKPCECGCGEMTRRGSKFRPGHDMKLKSKLRKAAKDGNANAKAKAQKELKSRGWVK